MHALFYGLHACVKQRVLVVRGRGCNSGKQNREKGLESREKWKFDTCS